LSRKLWLFENCPLILSFILQLGENMNSNYAFFTCSIGVLVGAQFCFFISIFWTVCPSFTSFWVLGYYLHPVEVLGQLLFLLDHVVIDANGLID
jgi:hypothetical protein